MKAAWRKDQEKKFNVLHRDGFRCRYCGAMPGSDLLEVDHLIPRSKGGSDNDMNLVCACKTCNRRKSDTIVFPHDLIHGQDEDGWYVHKIFGEWAIVFCSDDIAIEKKGYGPIHASRIFETDWMLHFQEKTWSRQVLEDAASAFDYMRLMIKSPTEATDGR